MSLTICSPQLGLNPKSILGGEVFDREILLGLAQNNVKVEIILPKNKSHDKNVKNWNITYLPISRFPAILGNFLIIPYLFIVYKSLIFDVLRIHSPKFLGLGCIFFKLFHKQVKLLATYHKFEETNFGPFSEKINNLWDYIICDSHYVKNLIIKHYNVRPSKITVVHNGVPTYLKPAPKDKTLIKKLKLEGKTVLLSMGLFIKRKNPLFLIDVLKKINDKKLVLLFWGQGPLKDEIIQKVKELGISSQIRIIKPLFGKEKNKIHNLADIFVHPSVDEGFALAPLEAMSCAKPVVMTDGYSAKEVVGDNVNGFLCRSNDLNHWNQKLSELIENSELRVKMGKASFLKAKKEFQWKLAVNIHLKLFRSLS